FVHRAVAAAYDEGVASSLGKFDGLQRSAARSSGCKHMAVNTGGTELRCRRLYLLHAPRAVPPSHWVIQKRGLPNGAGCATLSHSGLSRRHGIVWNCPAP